MYPNYSRKTIRHFWLQDRCKRGLFAFDVGRSHVEFNFFEDQIGSPTSFVFGKVPLSYEIGMDDVWCYIGPHMFD